MPNSMQEDLGHGKSRGYQRGMPWLCSPAGYAAYSLSLEEETLPKADTLSEADAERTLASLTSKPGVVSDVKPRGIFNDASKAAGIYE